MSERFFHEICSHHHYPIGLLVRDGHKGVILLKLNVTILQRRQSLYHQSDRQ